MTESITGMEILGEKLIELLAKLPSAPVSDVEIHERGTATTTEALVQENGDVNAALSLHNCTPNLLGDWSKLLYQEDPTVVAAAAAAAAVKFRSSYLPPIGVFWDIENCQVQSLPYYLSIYLCYHVCSNKVSFNCFML